MRWMIGHTVHTLSRAIRPLQGSRLVFTAEDGAHNEHHEHHEHMDHSDEGSYDPTEWQVRAVHRPPALVEAILDSGSDTTVLPMTYLDRGQIMGKAPVLRDAQGNELTGTSQRKVELVFEASTGEKLKVRQMATVAEAVRQPLLSAGKFLKNGWTPGRDANGNLHLKHDRDGYRIPIHYSGNSLAVKVEIRRVDQQYVREICLVPKANKIIEDTWFYVNGVPTYRSETDRHVDGRKRFGISDYPYRTTMILVSDREKEQYLNPGWKPDEEVWEIIECAAQYAAEGSMVEANAPIPDLEGPTQTLTMLHLVPMTEQEVIALVGKPARKEGVQEEDLESERPHDAVLVQPAEPEQQLVRAPSEFKEIIYGENVLTAESPLRVMRRVCQFYGLPKTGSKKECWERLTRFLANAELDAALEVAKKCQDDLVRHGEAIPLPKDVSPQEKEQHELTHLPKAPWCESCTATKSREDTHKRADLKDIDDRVMVHIDFGYITGEPQSGDERAPSTTFLCAVESQTKWWWQSQFQARISMD